MKKEIAKLWAEALESGEYKQCRGRLRDSSGYCCLGVLTDLYHKVSDNGEWKDNIFICDNRFWDSSLPPPVMEWSQCSYLYELQPVYRNDNLEEDFKTIAAAIRELYLND